MSAQNAEGLEAAARALADEDGVPAFNRVRGSEERRFMYRQKARKAITAYLAAARSALSKAGAA